MVEQLLLVRVWLYESYLQPQSSARDRKLESTLPITTIILNTRSEKFANIFYFFHMFFLTTLINLIKTYNIKYF